MKNTYPIQTPKQLGPILLGLRKQRGLTQDSVARKVGIAQNMVSVIETDPSRASFQRIFQLLSALDAELVVRERSRLPSSW